MRRMIVTKYRAYKLAPDQKGTPIAEYFPAVRSWPEGTKGAKVYETPDGPVIAVPEPSRGRQSKVNGVSTSGGLRR
jgi:hypothetical protein